MKLIFKKLTCLEDFVEFQLHVVDFLLLGLSQFLTFESLDSLLLQIILVALEDVASPLRRSFRFFQRRLDLQLLAAHELLLLFLIYRKSIFQSKSPVLDSPSRCTRLDRMKNAAANGLLRQSCQQMACATYVSSLMFFIFKIFKYNS